MAAALLIGGCSTRNVSWQKKSSDKPSHVASEPDRKNYTHPTMRPYMVHGKRYYPTIVHRGEMFKGIASWYGPNFNGKLTSNGETYDMYAKTAAHKTLPMNTIVKVDNLDNGKSVTVRINDRGPFVGTRIIDLSKAAAKEIDMQRKGTARVRLTVLGFQKKGSTSIPDLKKLQSGPEEKIIGSFAVQIGSFRRFEGALITQEKYDNYRGYSTIIKDMEYGGERIFRVWLTGFKSDAEARDFIAESEFKHSFIARE